MVGGTIATDQAINPYDSIGTTLQSATVSTLPEAGTDKAIMDTTKPKMTLEKWNGEVVMGVTYDGMQATGARPFLSKNVEWSDGNQTMQVVPLEASSTMEDGGYEINIILDSKPASNVFNFSIDGADNLDFFYQAPLWQEAGLKAPTKDCTDIDCIIDDQQTYRPQNVVGSYAVYYKDHHDHIEGEINYAAGKAYHIFRPKVTDAVGNEVWADMSYANDTLTVAVPQIFLNNATYPVKVDPDFGNTNTGVSSTNNSANAYDLSRRTSAPAGTITSLSSNQKMTASTCSAVNMIYDDSSPNGRLDYTATITISTQAWYTSASTLSFVMVSGTTYWIGSTSNSSSCTGNNLFFFDAGAGVSSNGASYSSPPASTLARGGDLGRSYSAYVTYTAAVTAVTERPILKVTNGLLKTTGGLLKIKSAN